MSISKAYNVDDVRAIEVNIYGACAVLVESYINLKHTIRFLKEHLMYMQQQKAQVLNPIYMSIHVALPIRYFGI